MSIDVALAEFKPDDYTPRLVNTLFGVIPGAPTLTPIASAMALLATRTGGPTPQQITAVMAASADQDLADVLWMGRLIDSGDKGYAFFTGLQSVWNLFRGNQGALDTDVQQRNDAALKALGLAYIAYNAFPGSVSERAQRFAASESGRALLTYYAAVEVALPFTDNAVAAGGSFFSTLLAKDGAAQASRLASMAQGRSLEGALAMLDQLKGTVDDVVSHAVKYAKPATQALAAYVPAGIGTAVDSTAGIVANAADIMPVYTYLTARLAAESAVARAL
jgi:hypothetical protein